MAQSKHNRVVHTIKQRIESGQYKPGDKLPTYRQLAAEFGVHVTTVRNAMLELRALRLVETQLGEGVTVRTDAAGVR